MYGAQIGKKIVTKNSCKFQIVEFVKSAFDLSQISNVQHYNITEHNILHYNFYRYFFYGFNQNLLIFFRILHKPILVKSNCMNKI